jgi:hypothetical protein
MTRKGDHSRNCAPRWMAASLGILCIGSGTWQLERERSGLSIAQLQVGRTPATIYYVAYCEAGFLSRKIDVRQMSFAKAT